MPNNPRNLAVRLLNTYIQQAWEAAGLRWKEENASDVEYIVDQIIKAAKQEIQKEQGPRQGRLGDFDS